MHAVRGLFTTADGIDADQYAIATFSVTPGPGHDLRAAAAKIALVASVGTVTAVSTENAARRLAVGPRVLHPSGPTSSDGGGQITIALPVSLIGDRDPLVYLMSICMFGAEYNYVSAIRLESVDVPRSVLRRFAGPRFGLAGIREAWGVTGRPILAAILKPRLGVALPTLAAGARSALEGGADVVFDDELVVDPDGENAFEHRAPALVAAAKAAEDATGRPKGAVVNITGRPSRATEYGHRAAALGASGVMFNGFVGGLPALQDVVDSDIGLPVLACNVGSGFVTRASNPVGISSAVLAKLSRLAGADGFQTGILAGDAYTVEAWGPSVIALDRELEHLRPAMPIVAGGLNVANLWGNWMSLGNEAIFAAGAGIFGYPGGPEQGAAALALLLDELRPDMPVDEAHETIIKLADRDRFNLRLALNMFGYEPAT